MYACHELYTVESSFRCFIRVTPCVLSQQLMLLAVRQMIADNDKNLITRRR